MKLGHRAVLYGLNSLCTAFLWLVGTGTPGDDFNLYFIVLVLVWLFAPAPAPAIPLAYRLGGAPAADAGGGAAGAAARLSPRCGAPPEPGAGARTA